MGLKLEIRKDNLDTNGFGTKNYYGFRFRFANWNLIEVLYEGTTQTYNDEYYEDVDVSCFLDPNIFEVEWITK